MSRLCEGCWARYNPGVATTALLSEEEYLRTSFPGGDREFHGGELRERGLPAYSHGKTITELSYWFRRRAKRFTFGLRRRFESAWLPVFWPTEPDSGADPPAFGPLIAIEVVSSDDSCSTLRVPRLRREAHLDRRSGVPLVPGVRWQTERSRIVPHPRGRSHPDTRRNSCPVIRTDWYNIGLWKDQEQPPFAVTQ